MAGKKCMLLLTAWQCGGQRRQVTAACELALHAGGRGFLALPAGRPARARTFSNLQKLVATAHERAQDSGPGIQAAAVGVAPQ
eukprot:4745731-Alexandrium_andersonii.AAC.1